jgi:excisionase family DNA binding protein
MQGNEPLKFMTSIEVSNLLRIKRATLNKWAKKHGMPHYRIGHNIRFRKDDLLQWCEEKKVGSGTPKIRDIGKA